MPISVSNGESGLSVRNKINGSLGVESGALADPYQLTFDIYHRIRTLTVDADIELGLSSDPDHLVSNTFETIYAAGDDTHDLTFPAGWVMSGDVFNPTKMHAINLMYTGTYVVGSVTVLGDVPDLTVPTLTTKIINAADSNLLYLTFSEAVNITSTGWSVSASGGAVTISSVIGTGTTTPKFLLSRVITSGETVTISYNPATGSTADTGGNEVATISASAVTNNATTGSTLLTDNFNDASLDLTKWDLTNPADGVTISETTTLNFAGNPASAVASTNTNHVDSDLTFNDAVNVFRVTLSRNSALVNTTGVFKIYNSGDTYATARQIQLASTSTGKIYQRGYNGSTFSYDPGISSVDWATAGTPIKIVRTGTNIKFYYHNGSYWVLVTDTTFDIGGAVKVSFGGNSSAADSGTPTSSYDDLYVTNYDYGGLTP
jgi:hypothetical protein